MDDREVMKWVLIVGAIVGINWACAWLARCLARMNARIRSRNWGNPKCSFCRKRRRDVGPLVQGPRHVLICDSCINLCRGVMDKEKERIAPVADQSVQEKSL